MALQVPGLFTSIIVAIVAPRNTSSDINRAGPGVLIGVGAVAFMIYEAPTLRVFRAQRKEENGRGDCARICYAELCGISLRKDGLYGMAPIQSAG